jgi:hypothetical protein
MNVNAHTTCATTHHMNVNAHTTCTTTHYMNANAHTTCATTHHMIANANARVTTHQMNANAHMRLAGFRIRPYASTSCVASPAGGHLFALGRRSTRRPRPPTSPFSGSHWVFLSRRLSARRWIWIREKAAEVSSQQIFLLPSLLPSRVESCYVVSRQLWPCVKFSR